MNPSGSDDPVPSNWIGTPTELEYGPPASQMGGRLPVTVAVVEQVRVNEQSSLTVS